LFASDNTANIQDTRSGCFGGCSFDGSEGRRPSVVKRREVVRAIQLCRQFRVLIEHHRIITGPGSGRPSPLS
jgi:hypothetical protein